MCENITLCQATWRPGAYLPARLCAGSKARRHAAEAPKGSGMVPGTGRTPFAGMEQGQKSRVSGNAFERGK